MKPLEQITHGTECGFNRTVEVDSEGGVSDAVTRTGQERGIREVR